ncbi:hypothetical protein ACFW2D_12765 [Streptomyces sp. NPDC058914]|uniref:hypothetical protein n=1 Tax=Streptomyces sp. NPDC058914 TaxID=3346671 RepID=UPI0036C7E046
MGRGREWAATHGVTLARISVTWRLRSGRPRKASCQEGELARDNHGFEGRSVEELWRDPKWQEFIFTGGTGTVLDFPLMIEAADTDDGPFMRPLTDGEVRAWAPHGRPTYEEWDAGRGRLPARGSSV